MTQQEIYELYVLQSKNVRKLKKVESNLVRTINNYLKKNDTFQVELNTKLYALVYCTLSEAQFIQIVNTPDGFLDTEIEKIKLEKSKNGLIKAWELLFDMAFDKVNVNWKSDIDLTARKNELQKIIDTYIKIPSELRNKIAHGQWDYALNRENTALNKIKTQELKSLTVVQIKIWSEIHQFLGLIVRDLIQSPKNGFHNNYWVDLVKLQQFIIDSNSWTMNKRIKTLRPVKQVKTCAYHNGISINVTDETTGAELKGVLLSVNDKTSLSDIDGVAEIIKIKQGTYNATVSLDGYVSQTLKVLIEIGTLVELDVKLAKV